MNHNVPKVSHTEFEGYKAITLNTINDFPKDVNGLKEAIDPSMYKTPHRRHNFIPKEAYANSEKVNLQLPPLA